MADITLAESIAQSLAADIVGGQFRAGQRLDEQTIAERFNVSRSPVRDALRRLATTHLVEYASRRGFSVTRLEPTHLQDMYDALGEIEGVCAKLCALRATAADRMTLKKIYEAMCAPSLSPKEYAALNEDFHKAIYDGSHNKTIAAVALDVRRRLAPFRSRLFFQDSRVASSIAEHAIVLDAIIAYDADKALGAMRNHTASTALNVLDTANSSTGMSDAKPAKAEAL